MVANPKWAQAVKGNKDDEKDFQRIGDLFRIGLVKGSFIPDKPIRILRDYRSQQIFQRLVIGAGLIDIGNALHLNPFAKVRGRIHKRLSRVWQCEMITMAAESVVIS